MRFLYQHAIAMPSRAMTAAAPPTAMPMTAVCDSPDGTGSVDDATDEGSVTAVDSVTFDVLISSVVVGRAGCDVVVMTVEKVVVMMQRSVLEQVHFVDEQSTCTRQSDHKKNSNWYQQSVQNNCLRSLCFVAIG